MRPPYSAMTAPTLSLWKLKPLYIYIGHASTVQEHSASVTHYYTEIVNMDFKNYVFQRSKVWKTIKKSLLKLGIAIQLVRS